MTVVANRNMGVTIDISLTGTAIDATLYRDLRLRRHSGQEHQDAYYGNFTFHSIVIVGLSKSGSESI